MSSGDRANHRTTRRWCYCWNLGGLEGVLCGESVEFPEGLACIHQTMLDNRMNMPQVQFLRASVGKWIGGGSVVPDQASARAFAGAINDDTTELLDGTSVTPMFGIVPIYG